MIVDQEKYQYLRGCIGAMDNMKKTISSLKKEIKEKQEIVNTENNQKDDNAEVKQENNTQNPKTGDNVIVYFVLFAISILGIVTLIIRNNKKSKKQGKH